MLVMSTHTNICACSQQHYSKHPRSGNHPGIPHLMTGQVKCDVSIHGILLSNEKEPSNKRWYSMGESEKHNAK